MSPCARWGFLQRWCASALPHATGKPRLVLSSIATPKTNTDISGQGFTTAYAVTYAVARHVAQAANGVPLHLPSAPPPLGLRGYTCPIGTRSIAISLRLQLERPLLKCGDPRSYPIWVAECSAFETPCRLHGLAIHAMTLTRLPLARNLQHHQNTQRQALRHSPGQTACLVTRYPRSAEASTPYPRRGTNQYTMTEQRPASPPVHHDEAAPASPSVHHDRVPLASPSVHHDIAAPSGPAPHVDA